MRSLSARIAVVLFVAVGALVLPQAASAAILSALGISCNVEGDGVRFCSDTPRSTVASPTDDVPIDVNVAFPPAPAAGPDGNYPLVMIFHGYGGSKIGLGGMRRWVDRGYATFSMTDRGFDESCGSPASQVAAAGECLDGYVRLIDNRYEVRDAQEFAGMLADEGLIDGQKIGAIGGSYGGGMSMALGALKNRVVNLDYSLSPWTSPMGKPMQIAAAAPEIPWTDLAYSLAPNGSTLDYVADAPYRGRPGVEKASFVTGLYLSGLAAPGFYSLPGTDPTADLTGWRTTLNAGEPYGANVQAILDEITQHHSSYYIDHSIPPAPMLMSSGFTDDLFPADETIRFYNRTKTQYPDADIGLTFGDFGHMRGANKPDFIAALGAREHAWFDHYVKGEGSEPRGGVEAFTQTCPDDAPSGGPYASDSWASIAPGEIRFTGAGTKTIAPDSITNGDFNPVTSSGPCGTIADTDEAGSAAYRLDPAPEGGYTMMGAATVVADFTLSGDTSQVAARLLDVAPNGQATLVDRGLWRPATGGPTKQVFQLHPNGWHFAAGHVPKLELLAADGVRPDPTFLLSYGLPSNNQQPVTVSDLELRIPVVEKPGALGGLVKAPAKKFLPSGYELARDFAQLERPVATPAGKKLKAKGGKLTGRVACPAAFAACHDGTVVVKAKLKKKPKGGKGRAKGALRTIARGSFAEIAGGSKGKVKSKLNRKARRYFKQRPKLAVWIEVTVAETDAVGTGRAKAVAKKGRKGKR
jgi:predicted acyl esterase